MWQNRDTEVAPTLQQQAGSRGKQKSGQVGNSQFSVFGFQLQKLTH